MNPGGYTSYSIPAPRHRWIVGVDLGQSIDPTAIAVVEAVTRYEDRYPDPARALPPELNVLHLERLPLRMPYPEQVAHVGRLLAREPLAGKAALALDQTGVGRAVCDFFRRAGMRPVAVTITAGDGESVVEDGHRVAKLRLVSRLTAALHSGQLRIAPGLKEAKTLAMELQDFRASYSDTGYARFGAREGAHDDLVLAVAIAAWYAEYLQQNVGGTFRWKV